MPAVPRPTSRTFPSSAPRRGAQKRRPGAVRPRYRGAGRERAARDGAPGSAHRTLNPGLSTYRGPQPPACGRIRPRWACRGIRSWRKGPPGVWAHGTPCVRAGDPSVCASGPHVRPRSAAGVPCSSRIPLGIFLSPALTEAFRCFLNLGDRRVRVPPGGAQPAARGHPPGEPGEAAPGAHGPAALGLRAPRPFSGQPRALISSCRRGGPRGRDPGEGPGGGRRDTEGRDPAGRGWGGGTLPPEEVDGREQQQQEQQRQQQPGQQRPGARGLRL